MDFKLPSWAARNPLGIIALFISLIYAMSALLLGVSIKNLTETNQTLLVVFIILFPVLVLGVFAWLVACHPNNLYGPGDFRSDEGFHKTLMPSAPSEIAARLRREAESVTNSDSAPGVRKKVPAASQVPTEHPMDVKEDTSNPGASAGTAIQFVRTEQKLFVAETLVFEELQKEFRGSVQRNVQFRPPLSSARTYEVDGIIETPAERILVEIKAAREIREFVGRLPKTVSNIMETTNALRSASSRHVTPILAVILYNDQPQAQTATNIIKEHLFRMNATQLAVRVYGISDLMTRYGLAS